VEGFDYLDLIPGSDSLQYAQTRNPRHNPVHADGQLRELEAEEIVFRQMFAEVPLRVEYSLSDHGKTLGRVLRVLAEWGQTHPELKKSSRIPAAPRQKSKPAIAK
jgi:HxlR-like helix-turn-helix